MCSRATSVLNHASLETSAQLDVTVRRVQSHINIFIRGLSFQKLVVMPRSSISWCVFIYILILCPLIYGKKPYFDCR